MDALMALDRLMAGRGGDGLHPRLRALLEERARIDAAAVALDRFRDPPTRQAGPHPAARPGTGVEPAREHALVSPQPSAPSPRRFQAAPSIK